MTGLVARRPGRSLRLVRTIIEVGVLAVGAVLGGTVGIGTIAYALTIGPLAQLFLPCSTSPSRNTDGGTDRAGPGHLTTTQRHGPIPDRVGSVQPHRLSAIMMPLTVAVRRSVFS